MNKAEQLIACLEGEIAKRDEELAACRVAVENCELFRVRIAELENECSALSAGACDGVVGDDYGHAYCRYKAELAAIKTQEPVAEVKRGPLDSSGWPEFVRVETIGDFDLENLPNGMKLYAAPVSEAKAQGDHVEDVRAMVAAPSPAGVDGLEVVAYRKPYMSSTDFMPHEPWCNDGISSEWEPLCRLSDAQAIIDGLRGEVERYRAVLDGAKYPNLDKLLSFSVEDCRFLGETVASMTISVQSERDLQAQRIGELVGHLEFAVTILTVAGLAGNAQVEAMRAALSAGKGGK